MLSVSVQRSKANQTEKKDQPITQPNQSHLVSYRPSVSRTGRRTLFIYTDFTKTSDNTIKYGVEMAKRMRLAIVLFHIMKPVPTVTNGLLKEWKWEDELLYEKNKTELLRLTWKIRQKHHLKCSHILGKGDIQEKLIKHIDRTPPFALLMGKKDENHILQKVLGTITTRIAKKAGCPVIIVPKEASFLELNYILFDVTYKNKDIENLTKLSRIAWAAKSTIKLFDFSPKRTTNALSKLWGYYSKIRTKLNSKRIKLGNVIPFQEIKENDAGLIAIHAESNTILERLLIGAKTNNRILSSSAPIVVF